MKKIFISLIFLIAGFTNGCANLLAENKINVQDGINKQEAKSIARTYLMEKGKSCGRSHPGIRDSAEINPELISHLDKYPNSWIIFFSDFKAQDAKNECFVTVDMISGKVNDAGTIMCSDWGQGCSIKEF